MVTQVHPLKIQQRGNVRETGIIFEINVWDINKNCLGILSHFALVNLMNPVAMVDFQKCHQPRHVRL